MTVVRLVFNILIWFLNLLPLSPIPDLINSYVSKDNDVAIVLSYVNYFVPIGTLLDILAIWSAAMVLVWLFFLCKNILNK